MEARDVETRPDRPRGPWLGNSDKSDLPRIENEVADDPALPAHTERCSQSSKPRQEGCELDGSGQVPLPSDFLSRDLGRRPSDNARPEYTSNSQFGWSDCVNQFSLKTKQIKQ